MGYLDPEIALILSRAGLGTYRYLFHGMTAESFGALTDARLVAIGLSSSSHRRILLEFLAQHAPARQATVHAEQALLLAQHAWAREATVHAEQALLPPSSTAEVGATGRAADTAVSNEMHQPTPQADRATDRSAPEHVPSQSASASRGTQSLSPDNAPRIQALGAKEASASADAPASSRMRRARVWAAIIEAIVIVGTILPVAFKHDRAVLGVSTVDGQIVLVVALLSFALLAVSRGGLAARVPLLIAGIGHAALFPFLLGDFRMPLNYHAGAGMFVMTTAVGIAAALYFSAWSLSKRRTG